MLLAEHIAANWKLKKDFAKAYGITDQTLSNWLKERCIVENGMIWSPRRELIKILEKDNE